MTFREYIAPFVAQQKTNQEILVLANSVQKTVRSGVWITARTLASKWGADRAGSVLVALNNTLQIPQLTAEQKETIGLILSWLKDPASQGIDVGDPNTRAKLPSFAAMGVITEAEVAEIYSWAEDVTTDAKKFLGRDATLQDVDVAMWQNENDEAASALLVKVTQRANAAIEAAHAFVNDVKTGNVVPTPPTWDSIKSQFTAD
jgi:hypothetical protein